MPTTPEAPRPDARQFPATMPNTPGWATHSDANSFPDLRGVADEKREVMDITNGRIPIEALDLPSVDQVVNSLRSCSIAHFACHGSTNHTDPSNSGLVLQKQRDGQKAERDWLTVHKISELSLTHARIAYLSACSTAENKAGQLSDEVIHVVSGFQVAGFPHVIGCLWPSKDGVCLQVAGGFYKSLMRRRAMGWDGRDVASALREAVMAVQRTERKPRPLAWAQFVHYGA
jgi:CHAT domain-containing protein